MNVTNHDLVSVKANLRKAQVKAANAAGRSQNQQVRFWIITMLLVLFGLSTLKLR
jgi:UDP-N-acetylmuramyl pentapeptide phosphotransferase/UDP-N-acetylglucosamine-1-phosphate transferase